MTASNVQPQVDLDIVIPVYNEGDGILTVLAALQREVRTPFRVLICYDHEDDTSVAAIRRENPPVRIEMVRNTGHGALGAVLSGFRASTAPAVLVFPGDDDYNAGALDRMVDLFRRGCDVVVASRFIPGGCMKNCPMLKAAIIRGSAWTLQHLAGLPTADASNGFRLFSRRLLQQTTIESSAGFAYSIELLVKAHRMGMKIGEVPVSWFERRSGSSRFRVLRWLPQYFVWYRYAFATAFQRLVRGAG
jgi:glycosyltransferase involved in cell wall biosynthesis